MIPLHTFLSKDKFNKRLPSLNMTLNIEPYILPKNKIDVVNNNNTIPLNLYTCWHTKDLPPKMRENYDNMVKLNPQITFNLYDEIQCREFIEQYFDKTVIDAYDTLIPSSYKSDLWRFCMLFINGGIYMDIKYICANEFSLIDLCNKEHFVLERPGYWEANIQGLYTALIVVNAKNPILEKCIDKIVDNVKYRNYGYNALYPTGPGLFGQIYFGHFSRNSNKNDDNIDMFFHKNGNDIIYKNLIVLKTYPEYRTEQLQYQNTLHYSQMWKKSCIYKIKTEHVVDLPLLHNKNNNNNTVNAIRILCICHIGQFDVFMKMKTYLDNAMNIEHNSNIIVDLFINIVNIQHLNNVQENIELLKQYYPTANIIKSDNYGFDIGSFFHILDIIKQKGIEYDYVLKIHTKTNDPFRENALTSILENTSKINRILNIFKTDEKVGCIGSKKCFCYDTKQDNINNIAHLSILKRHFCKKQISQLPFISGTMFWMRFSILKNVFMRKDLSSIYNSMNTLYSFDWNWYLCANKNVFGQLNMNSDQAYMHYYNIGKQNGLSGNLFHAIKYNNKSNICRNAMIEHAYERLFSYTVEHCNMRTLFMD